jgi:hypothetical protein
MKFSHALLAVLATASFLIGGSANASTIYVQTTPAGAAALAPFASGSVIDFDSLTPGTYASLTQGNVTITPDTTLYIDGAYIGQYNTFGVNSLHNGYSGDSFGQLTFSLNQPVKALGFFWGASDSQWTLNGYDSSNTLIESYDLPITHGSNAGDFVGIVASGMVRATLIGPSGDYIFLDNVQTSAVPLPASLPMFGAALLALGIFAGSRRDKRNSIHI